MRRVLVLLATLAVALGSLGTTLAAPASAAMASIISPGRGDTVAPGLRGVVVDVLEAGEYRWTLYDSDGDYYDFGYGYLEVGRQTVPVTVVNHADDYTFDLEDGDGYSLDSSYFTVAAAPRLTSPTVSPSTFFPVVRDGYRDSAAFNFRSNVTLARVDYEVRNSRYDVVTRHRTGTRYAGAVKWSWNGRNANGVVQPTGTYTIKATALTSDGRTLVLVSPRLISKTSTVAKRVKAVRYGDDTSSLRRSGDCYVTRDDYNSAVDLDCWDLDGGSWARARYDFTLPSDATNNVWRANGESGCCSFGVVRRTGERTSARGFRVEVYVTDYRAFRVDSATVTYTTTVRR